MPKLFKQFEDARIARKIAVLRGFAFFLGAAWIMFVVAQAASGDITARASSTGSLARAYLRSISWAEQPLVFSLNIIWLIGIGVLFIVGMYLALAKLIGKWHGRRFPLFQRKYPY